MLFTKLKTATALALLVALAATGVGLFMQPLRAEPQASRTAKDQPKPEAPRDQGDGRAAPHLQVHGIVKAVDAAKNTITVTSLSRRGERGGRGEEVTEEKTYALTKTAEVAISKGLGRRIGAIRQGKLADLAPGSHVVLELAADEKTVDLVVAEGPTVRGLIKAVDAAKNTITVTFSSFRRGEGRGRGEEVTEEKTYKVGPKADIGVDDGRGKAFSLKEAKLADLPAGAIAALRLSVDLKQAETILAEGLTVQGKVLAVDPKKQQLRLQTRAGRGDEEGAEETYLVAGDADVLLDDGKGRRFSLKEGQLADVPVGAVVTGKLSVDQQAIMSLRAEGNTVQGMLKAVDPEKNTITLTLRTGRGREDPTEDKTYTVAKDARILIEGKDSKLADIKVEENGPPLSLRLSLDQTVVQTITIGRGRR
jgi:hypothetical protein